MKRPPNIAIAGIAAIVAFSAILIVRALLAPTPQTPWLTDEAAAFALAREQQKSVLIDFHATWSVPSVEISAALDKLRAELDDNFIALRVDVSNPDDLVETMKARYGVATSPGVVFVDTSGNVLGRITHYASEAEIRELALAAAHR